MAALSTSCWPIAQFNYCLTVWVQIILPRPRSWQEYLPHQTPFPNMLGQLKSHKLFAKTEGAQIDSCIKMVFLYLDLLRGVQWSSLYKWCMGLPFVTPLKVFESRDFPLLCRPYRVMSPNCSSSCPKKDKHRAIWKNVHPRMFRCSVSTRVCLSLIRLASPELRLHHLSFPFPSRNSQRWS